MKILILSLLLLIIKLVSSSTPNDDDSTIRHKAFEYLLSKRDNNFGWSDGQTPAVILGLLSAKPTWMVTAFASNINKLISSNKNHYDAIVAHKQLEAHVLSTLINDTNLSETDSANLAVMTGALQASCFTLNDFHGIDLLTLVRDRLNETPRTSPAYASLVLILCNQNKIDSESALNIIPKLRNTFIKGRKPCPFCVETASMNIQALICIESNKAQSKKVHKVINRIKANNILYIDSMQNSDGSFGSSIITTSLALQANHLMSGIAKFDSKKAIKYLKNHLKEDGSFANSVFYTALAIPAFSHNTGVTGGTKLNCPEEDNQLSKENLIKVSYKINDNVYTQQTLRGSFQSERGNSLYNALKTYSNQHPDIFKLQVQKSNLGFLVSGINQLENNEQTRTYWRLDIESKSGGNMKPVFRGIETVNIRDDVIYVFSYSLVQS